MKNRKIIVISFLFILLLILPLVVNYSKQEINNNELDKIKELSVMVIAKDDNEMKLMSGNNMIYTITSDKMELELGDKVLIKYIGLIDEEQGVMDVEVIDYTISPVNNTLIEGDGGIFSTYYTMAKRKLDELSLREKIGQLILARYPSSGAISDIERYGLSGFVFFEKDFKDKSKEQVVSMISDLQKASKIPLLTAVDEEGGKIVRISSNSQLVSEKFKGSRELYLDGGMDAIREDTIKKSEVLKDLGLNVNLAPVVDVSTDPNDYMYERTIGEDTETTAVYAKTVINASKGTGVSYVLKHFPGYGNNDDTHSSAVIDNRSYESIIKNDLPPFEAGIDTLAEAVLVSHNIVSSIDPDTPASLSVPIHNLLRGNLGFTGVIITDDIAMGALSGYDDVAVKALLAGNNLIITTNYVESINEIEEAVSSGEISEEYISELAMRVLAWKYYKGLMIEEK